MLFNPIVGNIHNTSTNRFHPIIFSENVTPGWNDGDKSTIRYKSAGHHTTGFYTREEAIKHCKELIVQLKEHSLGGVLECLGKDFLWDGNGVPAMVVFFRYPVSYNPVPVLF